jgi:CelD/BcsL family acetyltransferase involved in cellulose biosynthesis
VRINSYLKDSPLSNIHWLSPDERGEWDSFVARHPLGLVYHLSSWQSVLQSAFKHIRGRFLVLRDGSGHIQAGLPVYTVASWLLGNRTVSIPFATMCDPLVSTREEFDALWLAIEEEAKQKKTRRIEIRTRHVQTDSIPSLLTPGGKYKHHYLPLGKPADALFRSFDKTTIRQRVEKARRAGIVIEERHDEQDMQAIYTMLVDTRRRRSLPPMPYAFFQAMHRCLSKDQIALYLAMRAGQPIGGLVVLKFKDMWTAEYSGVVDNEIPGVSPLLFWEAIQQANNNRAASFSFGRTSLDNTGLLAHKRSWATVEEDLTDFVLSRDSKSVPAPQAGGLTTYYSAVRLLMRCTPAPVHTILGRFAYRHLG